MMDNKWWDGVLQAMHEGEEWAYKIFARVRFHNAEIAQAKEEEMARMGGGAWGTDPALNALFTKEKISPVAEEARKYFEEPGNLQKSWDSTAGARRYNRGLNWTLGPIPFVGSTAGRRNAKLHPQWVSDNIRRISTDAGSFGINLYVLDSLLAAIKESRGTYGLPLSNVGGFVVKGTENGFSSHTWGAGIDFDSLVNPFSQGGALNSAQVHAARGKALKQYWGFKNPAGKTWKEYLDGLGPGQPAMPLYVFVAGPYGNNGIGQIFNKHGWRWGGDYRGKKDGMHFEKFNLDDKWAGKKAVAEPVGKGEG